ncbi:hypothetical protein ACTMTI_06230 [Nonomuraea sp. H19]|uniref:hypothetical protein n=1 Tax=Nonomuraea sp. H19 TaxID=3452206 RepID=UPI003F8B3673
MTMPPSPPPSSEPPRQTGLIIGLACTSIFGYLVINLAVGLAVVSLETTTVAIAVAAGFLALLGLGAGLTLVLLRKPWSVGVGLGLMIGWTLASIVSAGYCTGLNPEMYR